MKPRFLRLVVLMTLLCLLCGMLPTEALAWKTKTHNYSARLLMEELNRESGSGQSSMQYIDLLAEGNPLRQLPVDEEFLRAITRYPQAFYAGSQGPDAYPDLYVGQTLIHPYDREKDVGSEKWLETLVNAVNTMPQGDARDEALSFVLGLMLHYCGDLFGHDYVNAYALGSFPEMGLNMTVEDAKVVARHMAVESEMDRRIPQKYNDNDVHAPTEFLLGSLVHNGYADNGSAPIYQNYGGLPIHYNYLVLFRNRLRSTAETLRKSPDPVTASFVLFLDRWIADVDRATMGLLETSDVVAQRLLLNNDPNVTDVDIFIEEFTRWFTQWGRYITPVPDVVIKVYDISSKLMSILTKPFTFLKSPFTALKNFMIKTAKDTLIGKLDELLGYHFTELIKKPTGVLFSQESLECYESDMFLFQHNAESAGNAAVQQDLPAFYNTMMMMKLVLAGPEACEALLGTHGANVTGSYVMSRGCTATANNLEVTISTADVRWAGTDDNIYLITWGQDAQGKKYGEKKTLLDKPAYNDFERGKTDTYRVALGQEIPLEELHAAISKDYIAVSDDWKLNAVEIMPCHGELRMLQAGETYYNKADQWLKGRAKLSLGRLFTSAQTDPRFHYDSALNASALSFIRSLDESQQWRGEANVMWSNQTARQNVFFRLFKGFAPKAAFDFEADGKRRELSESGTELVTVEQGEEFRFSAFHLESCWNGVPATRRAQWKDTTTLNSGMHYEPVTGSIRFVLYDEDGETAYTFDSAIAKTDQPSVQKTDDSASWQNSSNLQAGTYQVVACYDGDAYNAPFTREVAMLRVLPDEAGHTVRVVNGTLDGNATTGTYAADTAVTIQADRREGWDFVRWESDDISAWDSTQGSNSPTAKFTMPARSVTVTAIYTPKTVTGNAVHVVNGTFSGTNDTIGAYAAGTAVTIQADSREGWVFDHWESDDISAWDTTQGATSSPATFTMPNQPVTVTAMYRPAQYSVTVHGGTGSGFYAPGDIVSISTRGSEATPYFDRWTGSADDRNLLGDRQRHMKVQFVMPPRNVELTAAWKTTTDQPDLLVSGGVIVSVNGVNQADGTCDLTMKENDEVVVKAVVPAGMEFKSWVMQDELMPLLYTDGESGDTLPAQLFETTITFTMPREDVFLFARCDVMEEEPKEWTVLVVGGSGDGNYRPGDTVEIEAYEPMEGEAFVGWERCIPSHALVVDSSIWKNPRVSFRMPRVPDRSAQPGLPPEGDIETADAYELLMRWLESQLDDNVMIFVARYEPLPLPTGDHHSDPDLPPTGDASRPLLWAGLCAAALAGTLVLLVQRRRSKR